MIHHKTLDKSILELKILFEHGHLNLNPAFQRRSVWNDKDRVKLIESILRNYPLPAIFLYKRHEDGELIYDVIDGKQRVESILMFMGSLRGRFSFRSQLPGSEEMQRVDWTTIKRKGNQHQFESYNIPIIEVDGDIGDIIDVFVRINSTGKALTRQEKRNALHNQNPFLKRAAQLAERFKKDFVRMGVFSTGQLSRMKHIELVCELMLSLFQNDVLNKKTVLDRVMKTSSFNERDLAKASKLLVTTLKRVFRLFPHLKSTRFRQVTDFYSLVVLIGKFEQEGLILTDSRRNRLAWDILKAFACEVDEVRELQRKAKGAKAQQELYRDYLLTVSQMTDDISQRRKREQILSGLLRSLFATKDAQRGFTSEQRRILWNGSPTLECAFPNCKTKLTWDDFTIDHINPHSKGGRSSLNNAIVMCRKHNSSKGNRRVARPTKK